MKINKLHLTALLFVVLFISNAQTIAVNALTTGCWKQLSVGSDNSIAIKNDGTLWTWGGGAYGQLGNGTSSGSSIVPIQISTLDTWKSVSAGSTTSFAIRNDGTLWAWGYNSGGMYGNGTTTQSNVPLQIGTGTDWKEISANSFVVLAIKTDGTLWGWGYDAGWGVTGSGTNTAHPTATQLGTSTNWKQISAGIYCCAAVQNDGTLWAWGNNANGQFGNGTNALSYVPLQIGIGSTWKQVSAARSAIMAIKTNGSLWVAGSNQGGEFGNGTNTGSANTFTRIGTDSNWAQVNNGFASTIALKTNGTLWGWGQNSSGVLGIGSTTTTYTPTQIGTATIWVQGMNFNFVSGGVQIDGTLWMWGQNGYGQLGNNTIIGSTVPVDIGCPQSLNINNPITERHILVYPNPAKDILYIESNTGNPIDKVMIYDIYAHKVLELNENHQSISISALAKGIYMVNVLTDNKCDTFKVVKM